MSLDAFRAFVSDAIKRGKGSLAALAIMPPQDIWPITDAQRRTFTAYYLAGYQAAKTADKNVALLGAGSARLTAQWLSDTKLTSYVEAVALADAAADAAFAHELLDQFGAKKPPVYVLPPLPGNAFPPPAASLVTGAALVPVPGPEVDHGVAAHLLGAATFGQRLQVTVPTADRTAPDTSKLPFVAVFQGGGVVGGGGGGGGGDAYAVAAVAGFSAGTDLDALFPLLARTRTVVEPIKADSAPTYPNLQVADDTHAMRVVDSAGAPVDCRVGDNVYVPAGDNIVYVLQGGSADGLAGTLRVATGNRLPAFELSARATADGLRVHMHNVATRTLAGTLRVIRPSADADRSAEVIVGKEFAAIPPDQSLELLIPATPEEMAKLTGRFVLEVTTAETKALVQRTAVALEPAFK